MPVQSLETLFLRFRQRGDTRALAEIFDRCAAELLRVGVHLTGDTAEAEDLVQATFLTAIERRETHDSSRPLLPWLIGILGNRARTRRKRAGRQLEPWRADRREPARPDEIAMADELDQALNAAIDRLPETLRQVVVLHLRHGLEPAAIAHALGRGSSTVRTQLQRGLARMRERLPRGHRALALAALPQAKGLDVVRRAVLHEASAAVQSSAALSTLAFRIWIMNKAVLMIGAGALALAVLFLLRPEPEQVRSAQPDDRPAPDSSPAPIAALEAPLPVPGDRLARVEPEPAAEVGDAAVDGREPPELETEPAESQEAWFNLRVVDPLGNAVARAEVNLQAIRGESGTHYAWPGQGLGVRTDLEGRAAIRYPRALTDLDNSKELTTNIEHPDYQPKQVDLAIALQQGEVVLERGGVLVISGWIDSPDRVVTDVRAHLGHSSRMDETSWVKLQDGRPSTQRMAPGRHELYLTHKSASGELFHSRVTALEFAESEERELHLELLPAWTLEGRLDPRVPRPVRNGAVRVNLMGSSADEEVRLHRVYPAEVEADGSFQIPGLPSGWGEVIAACEGWVSSYREDSPAPPPNSLSEEDRHHARELQRFDWKEGKLAQLEVAMQPGASMEVLVSDPDDQPLEGAIVYLWPNVHWGSGVSQMFLDREYKGVTDVMGRALVEGLPAGGCSWTLQHERFELPVREERGRQSRTLWIELSAGETARTALKMVASSE